MARTVLILGGGGMIGQKLAKSLAQDGLDGDRDLSVILHDISFGAHADAPGIQQTGDISAPSEAARLGALRADVIFHLAAIVSGQAETDFALGWQINMMSMWHLLESLRVEHDKTNGSYVPRLVFSSSIAVFGAPFPDKIGDEFLSAPKTSYGAQKAICDLMLTDYSRKGFVDGVAIRLPTICVRPGKPNAAASGFFSGIIREPLNGCEALLPVDDSVRHWHASPRAAVGFLRHAATLDTGQLEDRRALNLPGVCCSVAEQIEALRNVAGQKAVDLIKPQADPAITAIVRNWPRDFDPARARALGFEAETSFEQIIRIYIEDEM